MKYKIIYQKGGSNPPPIRTLEDYIAENFPGQLDLIRSPVQIRNNVDFQASEFSGSSIGDIVNAVDNIITARQTARLTPTPLHSFTRLRLQWLGGRLLCARWRRRCRSRGNCGRWPASARCSHWKSRTNERKETSRARLGTNRLCMRGRAFTNVMDQL